MPCHVRLVFVLSAVLMAGGSALCADLPAAHAATVDVPVYFSWGTPDPFHGDVLDFNYISGRGTIRDYVPSNVSGTHIGDVINVSEKLNTTLHNQSITSGFDGNGSLWNAGFCFCASDFLPADTPIFPIVPKWLGGEVYIKSVFAYELDNVSDARHGVELIRMSNGSFVLPADKVPSGVRYDLLYVRCEPGVPSQQSAGTRLVIERPQLVVLYEPATIVGAVTDTTGAIKDLNDSLMNTAGSSDIGSVAVSGAQSAMQEHMSFMEQVDALGDMFTSITAESDSRVSFPGISFGEIQIPPATVDIWEHMKPLESSCKTICTGVFIFAWFNGMRALYGRIFHDEKDVIVD